jgi:hypothetical protein
MKEMRKRDGKQIRNVRERDIRERCKKNIYMHERCEVEREIGKEKNMRERKNEGYEI